jgi:hypothetical protein
MKELVCPTCGRAVSRHDQPMPHQGDGRDVILTLVESLNEPGHLVDFHRSMAEYSSPLHNIMYHLLCAGIQMAEFVKLKLTDELLARRAIGIRRYDTFLQPFNGQFSPIAANQEIDDALNYTQQALMEDVKEADVDAYHQALKEKEIPEESNADAMARIALDHCVASQDYYRTEKARKD